MERGLCSSLLWRAILRSIPAAVICVAQVPTFADPRDPREPLPSMFEGIEFILPAGAIDPGQGLAEPGVEYTRVPVDLAPPAEFDSEARPSTANPDEIILRFEPEDLRVEENGPDKTSRFRRALKGLPFAFAKAGETRLPELPRNMELVQKLKNLGSMKMIEDFLERREEVLGKVAWLLQKARVPQAETERTLNVINDMLFSMPETIAKSNASSVGLDLMLFGGAGLGSAFSKLLGDGVLGRAIEKHQDKFFVLTGGLSLLTLKDKDGRRKVFLEVNSQKQRSRWIQTVVSPAGFDLMLTVSVFADADPVSGRIGARKISSQSLGVAGVVNTGDRVVSYSVAVPGANPAIGTAVGFLTGSWWMGLLAGAGSLTPVVPSVSLYNMVGERRSWMSIDLTKSPKERLVSVVRKAKMATLTYFGVTPQLRCEDLF